MRRTLTAKLLLIIVAAILAAACGGDKAPRSVATAVPAASQVAGADAVDPALTLAKSVQAFESASGYGVEYAVNAGSPYEVDGAAAYRGGAAVYVRTTFAGEVADTGLAETLFLPPDLYFRQGDGTWFVQSPWNVGARPSEDLPQDPNEPFLDYNHLISNLQEVTSKPGGGSALEGFGGTIDLAQLPALAGKDATGAAAATIWVDKGTSRPGKVEIKRSGVAAFTLVTAFNYDELAAAPRAPEDARPIRDVQFPDAPCTGNALSGCLEAQSEIQGATSCAGTGLRVCIVPLGKISPELVQSLGSYYRDQFGLSVTVLKPASIPADLEDPKRQQIDADRLITYMKTLFPDAGRDTQAVLIGLTPIDIYDATSHFRYLFGLRRSPADPKAVVSSARMDPRFYSEADDNELFFSRTRKLFSKYLGLLYFHLSPSQEPTSPMFDSIGGPADVDAMTEPLVVP